MSEERKYVIGRIFSNNVVMVMEPPNDQEIILLGKGIGFGQKVGNSIDRDDERIEKKFRMEQEQQLKLYEALINKVDQAIINISEEIISLIASELSPEINEHIHVALLDHIHFAIHRLRNDLEIVNPFLLEIQTLYPTEFALAERAAKLIEEQFDIEVPESEAGFLAMHIHSAVSHVPVSKTVMNTNVIADMVARIQKKANVTIDRGSNDYARLITHLRHVIERLRENKATANPLLAQIRLSMPQAYDLATDLGKLITKKLELVVPDDEIGYMAIHLFRMLQQLPPKNSPF